MTEYKCAYRFTNGEIEGFKGSGFSPSTARDDAHHQIRHKCRIIAESRQQPEDFDATRLILKNAGLTEGEKRLVYRDWKTNIRY